MVELARKLDRLHRDLELCRSLISRERMELQALKENFNFAEFNAPKKRVGFATSAKTVALPAHLPHLSQGEFEALPRYLRGRLTAPKINSFIDSLNRIANEKYSLLLRTNPGKFSLDQRQKVAEWRAAEADDTANKTFLTETDLKTESAAGGAFKFDHVARNILTILRQIGRIRESRSVGIVRYIFQ